MSSNAIMSAPNTGRLYKIPNANTPVAQQIKPIVLQININQGSSSAPAQLHREAGISMAYSTEDKLMPDNKTLDLILHALAPEEKEEFLQELLHASIKVVLTGKPEYIESLRHLLSAWEYTAMINANPELAKDIDEFKNEIDNDHSPGIEWRELLRG